MFSLSEGFAVGFTAGEGNRVHDLLVSPVLDGMLSLAW